MPTIDPDQLATAKPLAVVIGILRNDKHQLLISQRHAKQHLAHYWEFPGGKIEADETPLQALARELFEEIGIQIDVQQARPLLQLLHHYPERSVQLQAFLVTAWQNQPQPRENQPLRWVDQTALANYALPEANQPFITALQLPEIYAITPEPDREQNLQAYADFLLQRIEQQRLPLVQLRAPKLSEKNYLQLASELIPRIRELPHQCKILLQCEAAIAKELEADGIHLNHTRLWHKSTNRFNPATLLQSQDIQLQQAAPYKPWIISAACHSPADLQQALRINATCALLSPVLHTQSHPEAKLLGWPTFSNWIRDLPLPVYALGGMQQKYLSQAQQLGAQGIAGISGLFSTPR